MARTQLNMRVTENHVSRLDEMREAAGLTQSDMFARLVDEAYARQYKHGELYVVPRVDADQMTMLEGMSRHQLDDLIGAARLTKLELLARHLRDRKIYATTFADKNGLRFNFVLVYCPDDRDMSLSPSMFADEAEARRLLDFVANLKPAEAYRRWVPTVKAPSADAHWEQGTWRTKGRVSNELEQAQKELDKVFYSDDKERIHDLEFRVGELAAELSRFSEY